MKLSIVVSTQPASFSAVAHKGQLNESLTIVKNAGYDGVELAVRNPKDLNFDQLSSLLIKYKLPVPAIGTGQAYGEEGLCFVHRQKEIRKKAVDRIKSHLELAAKLDAVVIIGLVRGMKKSDISQAESDEWLIESLSECAADFKQVKIAIEPINRYETDIINTVQSGLEFLNKLKLENVGLLLDTFHMNIEEPSITESIIAAQDRLFHFHIADSNRWYPGAGHLDFDEIIETLERINYNGYISAEIMPLPDPKTATAMTIKNVNQIFDKPD